MTCLVVVAYNKHSNISDDIDGSGFMCIVLRVSRMKISYIRWGLDVCLGA